jgi:5-carboxymethyl-2-hydroxymuconate isomerase
MPHLVIQYTPNIQLDCRQLCQQLLDALLSVRDEQGAQVFPEGGSRVLTYPATEHAVGNGRGEYGFMYLNLRIVEGRSRAVVQDTGDRLMAVLRAQLDPVMQVMPTGCTLNIEETPKQKPGPVVLAYEGFHNTLRAVFGR